MYPCSQVRPCGSLFMWLLAFPPTNAPPDAWQQQHIGERSASPGRVLSDGALEATAREEDSCAAARWTLPVDVGKCSHAADFAFDEEEEEEVVGLRFPGWE